MTPAYSIPLGRAFIGDSRDLLAELDDNSRQTMFAKLAAALPLVFFWGVADACDTFTITGRVTDHAAGLDTWIGAFQDPLVDRAEPVESAWVDAGTFELEVPCAESVTFLAVRKGAVPLARRIPGSAPVAVDLRFDPGLVLAGYVHSDENLPIGGAQISIARIDEVEVRLPESLTTWRSSTDGAFVAEGLAPGTYRVAASAEGHIPAVESEVVLEEGGANRVDMRLPKAFFIVGRVVETSGLAVADAEIHGNLISMIPGTTRGKTGGRTVASDSEGAFRLGPFVKGQRVLVSARAGLSRSDTADFWAPADDLVLTLHQAVEIRGSVSNAFTGELLDDFALRAYGGGEDRSLAFRDAAGEFSAAVSGHTRGIAISAAGFAPWYTPVDLGSGGGEHHFGNIALEPERVVTGRVLDAASGLPVRAWVRRWFDRLDFRSRFQVDAAGRSAPVAWTDEDGSFRLSGLPSGDVRIETGSSGYVWVAVGVPDGTDHIEIEMSAVAATIEGMLVTDEGTPVEGEVLLFKVGGTGESRRVDQGRFSFEIAAEANDQYRLLGRSPMGRAEQRQLTIRHDNESIAGIQLVVRRLGRVSGLLAGLDTAEEAALDVVDESGGVVQHLTWSQAGHYALEGVPEGRFTLRARTTSGRMIAREFESDGHGETLVDLVFAGASRLSGVVTAGGRPIRGIEIDATPLDVSSTSGKATTTAIGAYSIDGLDDGEYLVRVRGQSFGAELSGDTLYDVELGPLHAISGLIRAEGPVLGALVRATATSAEGGSDVRDRVDSRGSYRIDGLREGEYTVSVSHPGYREVSRTVFLGSSIEDFDVHLSPADVR